MLGCGAPTWEPLPALPADTLGQSDSRTSYYDVKPIFDEKCVVCHSPGEIGPFSIGTYAEAFPYRAVIAQQVRQRKMPPWFASPSCNHYLYDRSLTQSEIDLISSWVNDGAIEGSPYSAPEQPPVVPPDLTRVDLSMEFPSDYTPMGTTDERRCFVFDWPAATTKFVTGSRVAPGNRAIVHHSIVYVVPPSAAQEVETLDANAPGLGYVCNPSVPQATTAVGSWSPGGEGFDFPAGTGVRIEPGSKIVLQIHYIITAQPGSDRTRIDFRFEDSVDKEAYVFGWEDPSFIADPKNLTIPAGNSDYVRTYTADPKFSGPAELYAVKLHMHDLGTRGIVNIHRQGGGDDCVLDRVWDPMWELFYGLEQPMQLLPGDQLSISCHWDNSVSNQPVVNGLQLPPMDRYFNWSYPGEMCIAYFYVTL
jgi:hypothetical protein